MSFKQDLDFPYGQSIVTVNISLHTYIIWKISLFYAYSEELFIGKEKGITSTW